MDRGDKMIQQLVKKKLNLYSVTYNNLGQVIRINASNNDRDIEDEKKELVRNYGIKIRIEPTI